MYHLTARQGGCYCIVTFINCKEYVQYEDQNTVLSWDERSVLYSYVKEEEEKIYI
jgi:hypothetical protein